MLELRCRAMRAYRVSSTLFISADERSLAARVEESAIDMAQFHAPAPKSHARAQCRRGGLARHSTAPCAIICEAMPVT